MNISKKLAVWMLVLFMACNVAAGVGGAIAGARFAVGPTGPAGPQGASGSQGDPGTPGDISTATCYFTGQTDRDTGTPICVYGRVAQ